MPIQLDDLISRLEPERTALVFGAGASVPSGAPTGAELARTLWGTVAKSSAESDDLIETASILARTYGRRTVVDAVVTTLKPLQPIGGILAIPRFPWPKLFTTNFDLLIERAYKKQGVSLTPIRSNYDFSYRESDPGARLFKIHGCITQDSSLGHKASMILTEGDYEEYSAYRQTLFASLKSSLLEGDVLVIGQSLRDRHLVDLTKEILEAKHQGAPGKLFVLVYNKDDLRAPLLEDRGAVVAFGGIDDFTHALASGAKREVTKADEPSQATLPAALLSTTVHVADMALLQSNIVRMFNGSPATYADIRAGNTFDRARLPALVASLSSSEKQLAVITGAAGVGKTTFARGIMLSLAEKGFLAFEHLADFPFKHEHWIGVESRLRSSGKAGVLFVDECTHFLRPINQLVDHLASIATPALKLVITANSAQWVPRIKSRNIFVLGTHIELSKLEDNEIYSMLNLLDANKAIANLVHHDFKAQARSAQFRALRQKCSADMFVCLKNIFATESLDSILLAEYEELAEQFQAYYRYVAALQAVGTRVHRQLVIRMLNVPPNQVQAALEGLHGIVDEYDISPKEGIYGWATRHIVIARKITEYKFSGIDELRELFEQIIDSINPSAPIELQSIRDLCDTDFGIGRLGDADVRKDLYRRLIAIAPGERIPWHRLIRELLEDGDLEQVEFALRDAQAAVGADAPIDRFKVRLLVARSQKTSGISKTDRVALLRKAYELASRNTDIHRLDKHSYTTLCEVAYFLVQSGENVYLMDEAINKLRIAADEIFDPDIPRRVQHYESLRYKL